MRDFPAIARDQCGVFSTWQAQQADWTASALRHATKSGRVHRVRFGAYQVADLATLGVLDEFEQRRWRHAAPAIGAALSSIGIAASHSTAAVLRGIPLIFIPAVACVTVASWHTGAMPHVHLHRCTSTPVRTVARHLLCTSVERTAIDLAREHGAASGVVALDYLLHEKRTSPEAVEAELILCARWPGVRAAREAASRADGRSESVLETRSRLKIGEFDLAKPEPQTRIGNEWGGFVARGDFYWDELGVVGEADGDIKYDGSQADALVLEKRRQAALEDLGVEVVRWGNADLRDFRSVVARLQRAFRRGQRRAREDRRWTILPPL
jgi:very-short-patch-repair endonuclease